MESPIATEWARANHGHGARYIVRLSPLNAVFIVDACHIQYPYMSSLKSRPIYSGASNHAQVTGPYIGMFTVYKTVADTLSRCELERSSGSTTSDGSSYGSGG